MTKQQQAQPSKSVAKSGFYKKPVILNAEAHKNLKFKPIHSYKHANDSGTAILLGQEFMLAAKEYPIVFAQDGQGNWDSVVLLSLKAEHNVFVGGKGEWKGGYIPAVFRRYPFILSPGKEENNFNVCFDEKSDCFNEKEGEALFDKKGEQTPTLKNVIQFLNEFQSNYQMTRQFAGKLNELGLLKGIESTFSIKDGEKFTMRGMFVVDEQKLRELDDKTIAELLKNGMLAWAQFHLMSLSNLAPLAEKFAKAMPKGTEAA